MSKDLKDFVVNNRKFLKLEDGETVKAVYHGYKIIPNRFDPEKEVVSYRLTIDGMDKDKVINWECGRADVAEQMESIPVRSTIVISRSGAGTSDTKYDIKLGTEQFEGKEPRILPDLPVTIAEQENIINACKQKGITAEILANYLKQTLGIEKRSEIPSKSYGSVMGWIIKYVDPKKANGSKWASPASSKKDELIEEEAPF